MGILIPRQLTKDQHIKLFSNPVSGIAADFGAVTAAENWEFIKNIRYSKSMMLGALNFWFDQYHTYWKKLWLMRTKFIDMSQNVIDLLQELGTRMQLVRDCPDSFLFSHRYIKEVGSKDRTCILLNRKYENIIVNSGFRPQVGTLDPFIPVMSSTGIYFSIFANEHPYIPREKIVKVGMTEKGNVYILHPKEKGDGAYTPTTKDKKTVQAPNNKTTDAEVIEKIKNDMRLAGMTTNLGSILYHIIETQSKLRIDEDD